MCYIVAKKFNDVGSYIVKSSHGEDLVRFRRKLDEMVDGKGIQIVIISNPMAFGEYDPYTACKDYTEFESKVRGMVD